MKTLKNRLAKKVEPCYLIQGEDAILYSRALDMIKKACNLTIEDFNFVEFDDETFDEDALLGACETMPIGCDKKVVLLKNVAKFSKKFKDDLQKYLKNPVASTCLVIFDFQNKFDFLICEKISAKRLDDQSLQMLIRNELQKHGKSITQNAVENLIESCCSFFTLICGELEKLVACDDNPITEKTVENLVCKETEFTVFELTDALSKKDASRSIQLLNLMPKDTKTFSLVLNHFRRLFFVATSDISDKELSSLLSVKEYAITKSRALAKNFSKIQLKNIYEMLNDVDFSIKNGQMAVENALFFVVFNILFC